MTIKLRVLSDIHLEFGDFNLPVLESDYDSILIIAGDIGTGLNSIKYINELSFRFKAIIVVLGNHDYYNSHYDDINFAWQNNTYKNVFVLNNSYININNQRFIGCTLWTNFNNDTFAKKYAQTHMNDYHKIWYDGGYGKLTADDTYNLNQKSFHFLDENLNKDDILITHHSPTTFSIPEQYKDDPLNYAFASDYNEFIIQKSPKLVVHGHTHTSFDYLLGKTRVVCNPRGYDAYLLNNDFNPTLTIDI